MNLLPRITLRWRSALTAWLTVLVISGIVSSLAAQVSDNRRTPLVEAVARVRPAVVNLRGQKTLGGGDVDQTGAQTQAVRQVNGMGTGVIIDPRGYILTNFHVVEDVRRIEVTLADGSTTSGTLMSHDDVTDLALVRIRVPRPLPVIPLGTSTDIMLAETVAALGNAYGYEDTVTRGIVSELGRTVQVSDEQIYRNLLQTDAPINPGNSGGPLVNLDGEMIGLNVAVRVGAQGIAFAIPVNDAIEVAAEFLREITDRQVRHGMVVATRYVDHEPRVTIEEIGGFSAAESADLQPGDVIASVDGSPCLRAVDFHRCLLEKEPGDEILVSVLRDGIPEEARVSLAEASPADGISVWRQLGIGITPVSGSQLRKIHANYNSGLRVDRVRPGSPAAREGIRPGDILVAMHGWRTESVENLLYVLALKDVAAGNEVVFYVIRNSEPFFGNIRAASNVNIRR